MALLDMNDLISQYAIQSGILNKYGQLPGIAPEPAPQQGGLGGLLSSPGLSQALLALSSNIARANEHGYGTGSALALGAQAFGSTLQAEKDKITEAEKQATQERLAALKDIIGLKTSQEEMGLRMQESSLRRRALLDELDGKANEQKEKAARREAIFNSGDPNLIKAYEIGGDDLAKEIFKSNAIPKERKTVTQGGVPYYMDTGQPVLPNAPVPAEGKLTDSQTTKKNLADEALTDYSRLQELLFDGEKINRGVIGPLDTIAGEGRTADQALNRIVQNTLYMKTGASAPDAEVEKNLKNYKPSFFDNDEQVRNKATALKQFLDSNIPPGYVPTYQQEAITPNSGAIPVTTPQTAQTKVIDGKTYVNEGGQWYQQ